MTAYLLTLYLLSGIALPPVQFSTYSDCQDYGFAMTLQGGYSNYTCQPLFTSQRLLPLDPQSDYEPPEE